MDILGKISSGNSARRAINVERASRSVDQAIDRFSESARPAVSHAASGAHRLVDRVVGGTSRVAQQLQETGTRLKDAESRLVNASSAYVREHPFQSVGIALAAGFLVSRLAISRKSADSEEQTLANVEAPDWQRE